MPLQDANTVWTCCFVHEVESISLVIKWTAETTLRNDWSLFPSPRKIPSKNAYESMHFENQSGAQADQRGLDLWRSHAK
jgi:hypothetical protein